MGAPEEIHVLVIFSCENGAVEQLALAAAVGAVQARASIRLRRVVDPAAPRTINTDRMDQDYVAPRTSDLAWADGLVLALPESFLPQIHALGAIAGKPVVSLIQVQHPGELWERDVSSDRNYVPLDRDGARILGRQVAETIRAQRDSSQ